MSFDNSENSNVDDDDSGNDLKGVPQWKLNLLILFFNILLFPIYLFNKYILIDVEKEEKKEESK